MANRPHLKLNTKKQADKPEVLKFNYGFGKEEDNAKEEPNYFPMAKTFRYCLTNFKSELAKRIQERNPQVIVPEHIDYIRILFQSQFDIINYFESWFKEFGLLGINFSKFNHEILFAIVDRDLFATFLSDVEKFIQIELKEIDEVEYSGKIRYVKEFKLLSTPDILQYRQHTQLMNIFLATFPLEEKANSEIRTALLAYLDKLELDYRLVEETNHLEVYKHYLIVGNSN